MKFRTRGRGVKAVSPAISTVIITGVIVALVSVAITFANIYLWKGVAEGDFNSAKQFMQTVGREIDDVAWMIGRTETVRYSTKHGEINFMPSALNYTIYVDTGSGYQPFVHYTVGVLLFNMPVLRYSLFDGYYEPILPSSTSTLILTGTSAPAARVYAIERLTPPMVDGSFIRVVVAPSVRSSFSNITGENESTFYVKLYIPVLNEGSSPRRAQSITLTGNSVTAKTIGNVTSVKVEVSFPRDTLGFDGFFFKFPLTEETIETPENSVLEVYAGQVMAELGVHA